MQMVWQACNAREGIQRFAEHKPDVTLMDLRLPDMNGIDAMAAIRETFPDARIIIVTISVGDAEIRRALALGARSYVFKTLPPNQIVEIIRQVHSGKTRVPAEVAASGSDVLVQVRANQVRAKQVALPFYKRPKK